MLVRFLPVIVVLAALLLALAPEAAAQYASGPGANSARAKGKDGDQARPRTAGGPVDAGAGGKAVPPGLDARQVRPAQAFPPERIARPDDGTPQAPSRRGAQAPDRPATIPAPKDDPRSVEERPDPGG